MSITLIAPPAKIKRALKAPHAGLRLSTAGKTTESAPENLLTSAMPVYRLSLRDLADGRLVAGKPSSWLVGTEDSPDLVAEHDGLTGELTTLRQTDTWIKARSAIDAAGKSEGAAGLKAALLVVDGLHLNALWLGKSLPRFSDDDRITVLNGFLPFKVGKRYSPADFTRLAHGAAAEGMATSQAFGQ